MKKKKIKHNYTSELELKSLLIRCKNDREGRGTPELNSRINKYVRWHTGISGKKYDPTAKANALKGKLRDKIVSMSEWTSVDPGSYERFGTIVLLMIKNILKKPQFSGYTYKDDFYSDAVYKIIRYMGNFDHTLISSRTGQRVNAFAYVSQIIHNSILFIINKKKRDALNQRKHVERDMVAKNIQVRFDDWYKPDDPPEEPPAETKRVIHLREIPGTLYDELVALEDEIVEAHAVEIVYPGGYVITFDEYNTLKPLLRGKVSIVQEKRVKHG